MHQDKMMKSRMEHFQRRFIWNETTTIVENDCFVWNLNKKFQSFFIHHNNVLTLSTKIIELPSKNQSHQLQKSNAEKESLVEFTPGNFKPSQNICKDVHQWSCWSFLWRSRENDAAARKSYSCTSAGYHFRWEKLNVRIWFISRIHFCFDIIFL